MTKLEVNDEVAGEDALLCPDCGDPYLHIESVQVATGEQVLVVTKDGVNIKTHGPEIDYAKNVRGAIIEIGYWCENGGHRGKIKLSFRKGNVFVDHSSRVDEENQGSDLWRD